MAEKIRVNISTLSSDLAEMVEMAKQARSNLENMKAAISALNATWDGPAHSALTTQFDSDSSVMEETLDALDKFLESVKFARDEYDTCEKNVSGKIDAIQV